MRLLIAAALCLALLAMPGCITSSYDEMKRKSAPYTGCRVDQMVISDEENEPSEGYHRWKVECAGKRYGCMATPGKSIECHPITE